MGVERPVVKDVSYRTKSKNVPVKKDYRCESGKGILLAITNLFFSRTSENSIVCELSMSYYRKKVMYGLEWK